MFLKVPGESLITLWVHLKTKSWQHLEFFFTVRLLPGSCKNQKHGGTESGIVFTDSPDIFLQKFVHLYQNNKELRESLLLCILKAFRVKQSGNINLIFDSKENIFSLRWIRCLKNVLNFCPRICQVLPYLLFRYQMPRQGKHFSSFYTIWNIIIRKHEGEFKCEENM